MRALVLALGAVAMAACASPVLEPAPSAEPVVGEEHAATALESGVRVTVDTGAWTSGGLQGVVPVKVHVENSSGRPLRIRYDQFSLVSAEGSRLAALPPVTTETGVGGSGAGSATYDWRGFHVAEPYSTYYPGVEVWTGPFDSTPETYISNYAYWPLQPTLEAISKALPEGVLDTQGKVDGFLYFRAVPEGIERLSFQAQLVDVDTGEPFGQVNIPLVVPG